VTDGASLFIRTLIIRDAEFAVTQRAVRMAAAMNRLTGVLADTREKIYLDQGRGRSLHAGGSTMWCPKWGWEILSRSPAQSYCSDHINLDMAAKDNSDIKLALDFTKRRKFWVGRVNVTVRNRRSTCRNCRHL
jgi:hypothetical protein